MGTVNTDNRVLLAAMEPLGSGASAETSDNIYTRRFNIHHTVLYYSTGKLAPEKVIVVVPLEQVRKEGSRVSFHRGSE